MEKLYKGQAGKILLLTIFLLLIPFMSSTMRSSYLYFLLNLLVLVLALDAGILGPSPEPVGDKKPIVAPLPAATTNPASSATASSAVSDAQKPMMAVPALRFQRVKKCPSMPSLFFIGDVDETGGEEEEKVVVEEEVLDDDDHHEDAEELFTRAEMFIGNFYKQLKMQREDSWNNVHA